MLLKNLKKPQGKVVTIASIIVASSVFCSMSPALSQPIASQTLIAQATTSNISNAELEQFAKIYVELATIEQQTVQQIVQVIEKEGMSIDRFNAIANSISDTSNSTQTLNPPLSEAEKETLKKIVPQMTQLQEQADEKIKEVFKKEKFEIERYKEIFEAVDKDPKLQSQVQQLIQN